MNSYEIYSDKEGYKKLLIDGKVILEDFYFINFFDNNGESLCQDFEGFLFIVTTDGTVKNKTIIGRKITTGYIFPKPIGFVYDYTFHFKVIVGDNSELYYNGKLILTDFQRIVQKIGEYYVTFQRKDGTYGLVDINTGKILLEGLKKINKNIPSYFCCTDSIEEIFFENQDGKKGVFDCKDKKVYYNFD